MYIYEKDQVPRYCFEFAWLQEKNGPWQETCWINWYMVPWCIYVYYCKTIKFVFNLVFSFFWVCFGFLVACPLLKCNKRNRALRRWKYRVPFSIKCKSCEPPMIPLFSLWFCNFFYFYVNFVYTIFGSNKNLKMLYLFL